MTFDLRWEPSGVVVSYSGSVRVEDVLACHERIAADACFDGLRFAIFDTLQVEFIVLTAVDVEEIDAFLQGPAWTNPDIAVVFVATHPGVLAALAVYGSHRAYPVRVCESMAAARALTAGPFGGVRSARARGH